MLSVSVWIYIMRVTRCEEWKNRFKRTFTYTNAGAKHSEHTTIDINYTIHKHIHNTV